MEPAQTSAQQHKLVALLARRRTQLMEKGKTRSHRAIHKRLPADAGDLARIPKGKEFKTALPTGEGGTDVKAYCKAVRGATATFKDGHRATQTALEDMFMRIINNEFLRPSIAIPDVSTGGTSCRGRSLRPWRGSRRGATVSQSPRSSRAMGGGRDIGGEDATLRSHRNRLQ